MQEPGRVTDPAERLCSRVRLNDQTLGSKHCSLSRRRRGHARMVDGSWLWELGRCGSHGSITHVLLPRSAAGSWTGWQCPGRCWGWRKCIPLGLWRNACSPAASECRMPGTVGGNDEWAANTQPGERTEFGLLPLWRGWPRRRRRWRVAREPVMNAQTQTRLILLGLFKSLIMSISDRRGELTYPSGTTMEMVMAQRSRTMHKENRTPWQDVTSTWDTLTHSQFLWKRTRDGPPPAWSRPHLGLEAEDGDRKTHQSRDAQTQNDRFGVVKAERRGSLSVLRSGTLIYAGVTSLSVPTSTRIPSWRPCSGSERKKAERIWPCASLFNVFTRRDTYKEDQQNDIPWKLPPVWMKLWFKKNIALKKKNKNPTSELFIIASLFE